MVMLDWVLSRRNRRCWAGLEEHFRQRRRFQDPPPLTIFGERSTSRTDASPWPLRRIEKAPHADSHGHGCAGPYESGSGAAAAVASDRGKDNIDTSPRNSSSPRPGPAPQSRPADLRTRTSHHPFVHYPLFPLCPLAGYPSSLTLTRPFARSVLWANVEHYLGFSDTSISKTLRHAEQSILTVYHSPINT